MYLRWSQLYADINLQRAWTTFPSYIRRYNEHILQGEHRRRNINTVRVGKRAAESPSLEVELCPKRRHSVITRSCATCAALLSALRYGSWRSRDNRLDGKRNITSANSYSRRYFAPTGAWRNKERLAGYIRPDFDMGSTGASREAFYFQFIITPTSDTAGTTILLHFNNKRYLFGNIAEGTQRACIQRGIGLKKVKHIFLTGQVEWRNTGGLIGMILTMADSQAAEREAEKHRVASANGTVNSAQKWAPPVGEGAMTIHGGENLLHTMASARRFVFRTGMPILVNEFDPFKEPTLDEPTWQDENVLVWAMPIAPSTFESSSTNGTANSGPTTSSPEASPGSNGKKRSHDQFTSGDDDNIDQHLQNQQLRQKIVTSMFSSSWSRDALFETPLADVKMPGALFVRDPETKKLITYRGPKPGGEEPLPDIKVFVRNPWPGALVENLPPVRDLGFKPAMSYIVQGYPQRGKFDPKKAMALKVPKGPSYSRLTAGHSVTLEDGTVVTPDMVLGPNKPGRGIAVVDLPSNDYVENLISRPEWTTELIRNGISAICWILGRGVLSHPRLGDFMNSFSGVEHIVSSEDVCTNYLALDSSAASAIRLSRINKKYFPVPVHDNVTLPQYAADNGKALQGLEGCSAANRGLMIQVEPKFLIKRDEVPPLLNTAEVVQKLPHKVQEYARSAHEEIAAQVDSKTTSDSAGLDDVNFDPEIITLGTGSALPSKYRNVSSTLLRTGKYGNFLFDCGENTLGQLRRVFDPPSLRDVLKDLKFIWISHLHADHHLGTVSVLAAQRLACIEYARDAEKEMNEPPPPVVVASESKMLKFLEEYGSVETLATIQQLFCHPVQGPILDINMEHSLHNLLGIKDIKTTGVDHCSGAQAISIAFENGFKFSYSGDCRPSTSFANIGYGSDVLVHEATFDDDMEGDALAKKHSTTGEALGVAASMKAKNVILTHFSQRYQKLPVMENMKLPSSTQQSADTSTEDLPAFLGEFGEAGAGTETLPPLSDSNNHMRRKQPLEMTGLDIPASSVPDSHMNICVAFDYMRIRVSDLKHFQKFRPALAALFEAEQTKLADVVSTPQERSDMINRGKGSKKSQQRTDSGKEESRSHEIKRRHSRSRSQVQKEEGKGNGNEIVQGSSLPI